MLFTKLIFFIALSAATCDETPTKRLKDGDQDWWKTAVFYQIYPRSFKDSNNDGIGDIQGIISKLDYLNDLGITATWLSPIYKSPQVDQGYDISDYKGIDPDYGTLDDLKVLTKKAHDLGIKVIMDLVPNHTSNKHEWFIKSENRDEGYEDFYVWHNGTVDENGKKQPPNNWISIFKNSAWEWSEKRQQYYLHHFAKEQPDLNYRNPKVLEAINEVITYWFDLGLDGFRVDAVPFLVEDLELRDEPKSGNPDATPSDDSYLKHIYTQNLPETYEIIYSWRKLADEYTQSHGGDARILMTEAYADKNQTMLYYGTADGSKLGSHFTFNFNLIDDLKRESTADDYVKSINDFLDILPSIYTPNWVLGNHDQHRVASRLGEEKVDICNMLITLLPGVAVTYNGEEIGQPNGKVLYEEGKDPSARNPELFDKISRDFERTPFQWDDSTNGGFNEGHKTWLPVDESYKTINVAAQKNNNSSHYNIYKALLKLRKLPTFTHGDFKVEKLSDNVFAIRRSFKNNTFLVVFNVSDKHEEIDIKELLNSKANAEVILSSGNSGYSKGDSISITTKLSLKGNESLVLQ